MNELGQINGWFKTTSEPIQKFREIEEKDKQLRQASKEFEGIFARMMIKEGFKSAEKLGGDDEDEDQGSEQYTEMAYDHLATHIAQNVGLGLSEVIYQNLRQKG